ncbi:vacuolar fusion protein CCZ1 homolog isoform X1 [Patiria miniata]|uniref:Vacuolar fusion protein CCZ1 homolog n=1 Tax=Patiria miniata TaxID=46514 RepID=A0A914ALU5_PATMI|nr:vacuolar fusion protein CCZ1 homolog isoform X1 [Patiria miniata]
MYFGYQNRGSFLTDTMTSTPRSCVMLQQFFIYNPTLGPKEGEEEKKILFYHPRNTSIDNQIKNVGLSEAVIKFTETFSTERPCESMHTQKTRHLYLQPEKDFSIIMIITVPFSEKTKDGKTYHEYHEEDIQDSVYSAVLKHAYKLFKLFMGSFTSIMENNGIDQLKHRLEHFYSRYLLTLRLSHSDILEIHNGILFLPLDKNTYLRIQCFINLVEASFSQIKYTAFLYNDQLVWSGLEQDDMRILYKYLTTSLFPTSLDTELKETTIKSNQTLGSTHYGKFVTGPTDPHDQQSSSQIRPPKIFVNNGSHIEELHLVVYRALSATVCLMVDGSTIPPLDWYKNIDSFIGPQLSSLASDIGEQYANRKGSSSASQDFKFVYFNQMNLAQKTTVHNRKTSSATISPEMVRLISDINADFTRFEEDGETLMKTMSDCWVVGKKSDQREFYVVINQKNATLTEINEEVKRLCAAHFTNIFFLD